MDPTKTSFVYTARIISWENNLVNFSHRGHQGPRLDTSNRLGERREGRWHDDGSSSRTPVKILSSRGADTRARRNDVRISHCPASPNGPRRPPPHGSRRNRGTNYCCAAASDHKNLRTAGVRVWSDGGGGRCAGRVRVIVFPRDARDEPVRAAGRRPKSRYTARAVRRRFAPTFATERVCEAVRKKLKKQTNRGRHERVRLLSWRMIFAPPHMTIRLPCW